MEILERQLPGKGNFSKCFDIFGNSNAVHIILT